MWTSWHLGFTGVRMSLAKMKIDKACEIHNYRLPLVLSSESFGPGRAYAVAQNNTPTSM